MASFANLYNGTGSRAPSLRSAAERPSVEKTMKKKSRRPKSSETSRQTSRAQTKVSVSEEKRPPGNRGRPQKTVPVTTYSFYNTAKDKTANSDFSQAAADDTLKHPECKSRSSGEWLIPTLMCCFLSCKDRKSHQPTLKCIYSCFAYRQTFVTFSSSLASTYEFCCA